MPYKSQKEVFSFAVEVAKKLRKENPKLAWKDAIKKAWTTAEVKKAQKEANEYKAKHGGAVRATRRAK